MVLKYAGCSWQSWSTLRIWQPAVLALLEKNLNIIEFLNHLYLSLQLNTMHDPIVSCFLLCRRTNGDWGRYLNYVYFQDHLNSHGTCLPFLVKHQVFEWLQWKDTYFWFVSLRQSCSDSVFYGAALISGCIWTWCWLGNSSLFVSLPGFPVQ